MDEVNPMAEMGFALDKQIILEPQGFITPNNVARCLASHFIKDGGKLYDLLDRYGNVITYVLNRDDTGNNSDSTKLLAPFLKAFDVTDYEVMKFCSTSLKTLPGAKEVMNYFMNLMPTFIDSRMYAHAAYAICDTISVPQSIASASELDLDGTNMSRQTCRDLRNTTPEITGLKMSNAVYELNVPSELDEDEVSMISTLDDIFLKKFQNTEVMDMVHAMGSVGSNEKAYALLDIRKSTQVDLDGTVYIGGEIVDFQAMDLVKDGNGLAMSFNGCEFAVHGSNIAVISDDCTVAAVIVAKFYDTGIQGVFDLVDNWNRAYLEKTEFPDRKLVDEMLRRHPDELPEVYRVTRENVDSIAKKSDAFRKMLFKKNETI